MCCKPFEALSSGHWSSEAKPTPVVKWRTHTYGYAYWLTAVPHAGLGYHFLRVQVRTTDPEGLQKEKWPNAEETKRRSRVEQDDGGQCTSAALISPLRKIKNCYCRYVWLIRPDIRMYCGRFVGPSLTAHGWSPCWRKRKTIQKNPCDYKGHTHKTSKVCWDS